jgi:hypothetical protein
LIANGFREKMQRKFGRDSVERDDFQDQSRSPSSH